MTDTKNTKEVIVAALELTLEIIKVTKDGIQVSDAMTIWKDLVENEEMKAKFVVAAEEAKLIPSEISDLSATEAIELAMLMLTYVPKLIETLKK